MFELLFSRARVAALPTPYLLRSVYHLVKKQGREHYKERIRTSKERIQQATETGFVEEVTKGMGDWTRKEQEGEELDLKLEARLIIILLRISTHFERHRRRIEKIRRGLQEAFRDDKEILREANEFMRYISEKHGAIKTEALSLARLMRDQYDDNLRGRDEMLGNLFGQVREHLSSRSLRKDFRKDKRLEDHMTKTEARVLKALETIHKHHDQPTPEEKEAVKAALQLLNKEGTEERKYFDALLKDTDYIMRMSVIYFFTLAESQKEFNGTVESLENIKFPKSFMAPFIRERERFHDAIHNLLRERMRELYQVYNRSKSR